MWYPSDSQEKFLLVRLDASAAIRKQLEVLEDGGEEEAELLPGGYKGEVLEDGGEEEAELLPGGEKGGSGG